MLFWLVTGDFEPEGEAGSNFKYQVKGKSNEPLLHIERLIAHTDHVAEIQKTLRNGTTVTLIS
jgi:hypothetical protein